jgi:hypothetical protein
MEPENKTEETPVYQNGDYMRQRHDTATSNVSEEWRNKTANDLLIDLLDPVRARSPDLLVNIEFS